MKTTKAITVPHEELADSPSETWSSQGFNATRKLRCRWDDRLSLTEQLTGSRSVDGSYHSPAVYPHFPAARVHAVAIAPVGKPADLAGDTQAAAYTHAIVTVNYSTAVDVQALVSERLEPTTQTLELGTSGLAWGAPPDQGGQSLAADEAPAHLLRGLDYILTLHQAAAIPEPTLSLIGKINSHAVSAGNLGLSFPPHTLLYSPPNLKRIITAEGAQAWQIDYRFRYRPHSWNHIWRPSTASWDAIYNDDGPVELYPPADFTELLTAFTS